MLICYDMNRQRNAKEGVNPTGKDNPETVEENNNPTGNEAQRTAEEKRRK